MDIEYSLLWLEKRANMKAKSKTLKKRKDQRSLCIVGLLAARYVEIELFVGVRFCEAGRFSIQTKDKE